MAAAMNHIPRFPPDPLPVEVKVPGEPVAVMTERLPPQKFAVHVTGTMLPKTWKHPWEGWDCVRKRKYSSGSPSEYYLSMSKPEDLPGGP